MKRKVSTYYRRWTNDRDLALEEIHRRAQREVSDLARSAFFRIKSVLGNFAPQLVDFRFTARGRMALNSVQRYVVAELALLATQMHGPLQAMRRRVFLLAYTSDAEVLSRLKGRPVHINRLEPRGSEAEEARIGAALNRFANKVNTEIERGYIQDEKPAEIIARVLKVFPKPLRFVRPPRELKPIHEAAANPRVPSITTDFLTDEEWQDIVDAYKEKYVPTYRGPDYVFDVETGEPELEEWYGWEVEQEIAHDFVQRVRDGTEAGATAAGIDDLMWDAILDDRTRPEHRLKHGLTSREIEAKLSDEWSDFEDQTIVPPGGFKCRCRGVPYEDGLPEAPAVSYEDFNEWLNAA